MKGSKTVKETSLAKEKVKGVSKQKSPQEAAGHNSGPQNKHTIVDQGCSWATPLKNCLDAVIPHLPGEGC